MVKIFKNFKEKKAFKPDFGAEGEHPVSTNGPLCVYLCVCIQCVDMFVCNDYHAVSQVSMVASCWE